MKQSFALLSFVCLCLIMFSFSRLPGGDVFELYLNSKRVHQQFVHADNSVRNISLTSPAAGDRFDVFYSHCGQSGTDRALTLKTENNVVLKRLSFPNSENSRSLMTFHRSDLATNHAGMIRLFYSSREVPQGKCLATLTWKGTAGAESRSTKP